MGPVTRTERTGRPRTENVIRSGSRVVTTTCNRKPRAQNAVCLCSGAPRAHPWQKTIGRRGSGTFGCPTWPAGREHGHGAVVGEVAVAVIDEPLPREPGAARARVETGMERHIADSEPAQKRSVPGRQSPQLRGSSRRASRAALCGAMVE